MEQSAAPTLQRPGPAQRARAPQPSVPACLPASLRAWRKGWIGDVDGGRKGWCSRLWGVERSDWRTKGVVPQALGSGAIPLAYERGCTPGFGEWSDLIGRRSGLSTADPRRSSPSTSRHGFWGSLRMDGSGLGTWRSGVIPATFTVSLVLGSISIFRHPTGRISLERKTSSSVRRTASTLIHVAYVCGPRFMERTKLSMWYWY